MGDGYGAGHQYDLPGRGLPKINRVLEQCLRCMYERKIKL